MKDNEISSNVLIALRRIMRAVDLNSKQLQKKYNLTAPQLVLLKEIKRAGEIPIGTLAKNVSLSNATVTGIVDRLEKRGMAERVRNLNDRRQVLVRVTANGTDILKNAPATLQDDFIKGFESLELDEQKNILQSLEKVAVIMAAERLDVAPILAGASLSESKLKPNNEGVKDGR
jgi:DNA-binding MarR family transcriptional regulator